MARIANKRQVDQWILHRDGAAALREIFVALDRHREIEHATTQALIVARHTTNDTLGDAQATLIPGRRSGPLLGFGRQFQRYLLHRFWI